MTAQTVPSIPLRFAARVVDGVVLGLGGWALGRVLGFGFGWLALTAGIVFVYFVASDAVFRATIGKAIFGLRVHGANGERPSLKEACLRESFVVLGALPFVGPLLALIAWVTIMVSIRKHPVGQGWHDRLAGGTRITRR